MPYRAPARTAARTISAQEILLQRHRRTTTASRHLRCGAAEVEVDVVDRFITAQPIDGPRHHLRITAVQLQRAKVLVRAEREHRLRLAAAVHETGGHDHLVHVDEVGPELAAQRTKRLVRHAGHRGEDHGRRGLMIAEAQRNHSGSPSFRLGMASMSSELVTPSRSRYHAADAIIAALSVHIALLGNTRCHPREADSSSMR